ncbi:hypothetical protein K505DRAFT_94646 [Melanomma pulvis-pyrius CBS 109.77]|uniref:Uncharacterized protein n=1 Tax=Melanomma pulvis-pyrius CBS 109.77 TaxID=1314802 RepID=A0A6A6WZR2_9PLEO|nr:hypothetical protein K505DRAFT_94646 [Melanomma pulvis-pyrius CBS 109.77]
MPLNPPLRPYMPYFRAPLLRGAFHIPTRPGHPHPHPPPPHRSHKPIPSRSFHASFYCFDRVTYCWHPVVNRQQGGAARVVLPDGNLERDFIRPRAEMALAPQKEGVEPGYILSFLRAVRAVDFGRRARIPPPQKCRGSTTEKGESIMDLKSIGGKQTYRHSLGIGKARRASRARDRIAAPRYPIAVCKSHLGWGVLGSVLRAWKGFSLNYTAVEQWRPQASCQRKSPSRLLNIHTWHHS